MANIPVNFGGALLTAGQSITGSFFTVVSGSATITGLRDAYGAELTSTDWIIPAGFTIPIFVTSCSLSSGAILLYN